MCRCITPFKIDLKIINSRSLVNQEFLKHLWQDSNILVNLGDQKNKHVTTLQIEFDSWWLVDASVEIFDLSMDDLIETSKVLGSPKD